HVRRFWAERGVQVQAHGQWKSPRSGALYLQHIMWSHTVSGASLVRGHRYLRPTGSLMPGGSAFGEEGRAMRHLLDDYVLDTQRYELHRAGTPLHLRPKVFQVLVYLLAHRDRVVPKAELLEHVWPNQFIGDVTLNSCLVALRKALGDGGRMPRFVRTLHGRG